MSIQESRRVFVFEKLLEGKMTNREAALAVGCSVRQIQRNKKKMARNGPGALIHGNTGRKPAHTLDDEIRDHVAERAGNEYRGTSCRHMAELLLEKEGLSISAKTISRILKERNMDNPCSHKAPKKRLRRERRRREGELLQLDASPFDWFSNGTMMSLHGAIDDATGKVTALWLAPTERLDGYFHVLERTLLSYGVPRALYMDGHTIFFSPKGGKLTEEEEFEGKTIPLTQFGRALEILGVQPIRATSPQAKGRVERLWGTLQKRLPVDLRLAGVSSVEEANRFLLEYVESHDRRFAVPPAEESSAFLPPPPGNILKYILCTRETRKTTGDSTISWHGRKWKVEERPGEQKLFRRGSSVEVLSLMDGNIAVQYDGRIFEATEITLPASAGETVSQAGREFVKREMEVRIPHKPKADHPWRNCRIQEHASLPHTSTAAV